MNTTSRHCAALLAATILAGVPLAYAQEAPSTPPAPQGFVTSYYQRVGLTDLTSKAAEPYAKTVDTSNKITWGVAKGLPSSVRNPYIPSLIEKHGILDAAPGQHVVISARASSSRSGLPTVCAVSATVGPDGSPPSLSESAVYMSGNGANSGNAAGYGDSLSNKMVGSGVDVDGSTPISLSLNCFAIDQAAQPVLANGTTSAKGFGRDFGRYYDDMNNNFGEHNRFYGSGGNNTDNTTNGGEHFSPADSLGVSVEFFVGTKDDGSDAKPLTSVHYDASEMKVSQVAPQAIPDGLSNGFVVDVLPYMRLDRADSGPGARKWQTVPWQAQTPIQPMFNRGSKTGARFALKADPIAAKMPAKPYFMHIHSLFVPTESGTWSFVVGATSETSRPRYAGCAATATLQGFDTPLFNSVDKVALDGTAVWIGSTEKPLSAKPGAAWNFDLYAGCGVLRDVTTQEYLPDDLPPTESGFSYRLYVKGPSDLTFRDPKPGEFVERIPEGAFVYGTNLTPSPAPSAAPSAVPVATPPAATAPVAAPAPAAPAPTADGTKSAADISAALNKANAALDLTIGFKQGSADLDPQGRRQVAELGAALRTLGTAKVILEGHTSPEGGDAINQPLSEKRAAAVATELAEIHGIAKERLSSKGFGASKPVSECAAANTGDACWAKDRRVTVRRVE